MKVLFIIFAMLVSTVALADYPKDTLHVERFAYVASGSGSGHNIAVHSFKKRYWTAKDCNDAAAIYNAQTHMDAGGNSVPVVTIAQCESLNPSIFQ